VSAAVQEEREIVTARVVQAPRDLVYRAWTEPGHVSTVVTFKGEAGKTRLDVRQTFHVMTPDIEQALAGADAGWNMTLDQLEAHVARA